MTQILTSWVSDGRAGSRAKLSCGTAAARRPGKSVSHESGRGTAAARRQKKTVVHRPFLVGDGDGGNDEYGGEGDDDAGGGDEIDDEGDDVVGND